MKLQNLTHLLLALIFVLCASSCASQKNEFARCDHSSLFTRGLKDGELGMNRVDSIYKICPKTQFESADEDYLSGRDRGLKKFCNPTRAQSRALLNLKSEEACESFNDYIVWFQKDLT